MDLSLPLSSLAPTLDAEVLTVLARTEQSLTGRAVAGLARRGSPQGIQKALDRLTSTGVVDSQPAGRAQLYALNRDHLLFPAVHIAVSARDTLIARLRDAIGSWLVPCVHGSLFGSLARGEAGPESDIDVLIVRPVDLSAEALDGWQAQLLQVERNVLRWTGNHLSWFETTEPDLARACQAQEPVVASWREDGLDLAGESLRRLLQRADTNAETSGM